MSTEIKREVREFYNKVGWKEVSDGVYQNARYEDLRPVSRNYIHRCHMRVARHLQPEGKMLLDAGSGPIQYPEYLEYSRGYQHRVCIDISIVALIEARNRIGVHGFFVVADIANLPFKSNIFDGIVSLHTIHHLPKDEHLRAYKTLHRVLAQGRSAVIVNGGEHPLFPRIIETPIKIMKWLSNLRRGIIAKSDSPMEKSGIQKGTHVRKHNVIWLINELSKFSKVEVYVWRSISVKSMRFYIRESRLGENILDLVFRIEELAPKFFGKYGQYPLAVITKSK